MTAATLLCVFIVLTFSGSDTQVWATTTPLHLALVQLLVGSPPQWLCSGKAGEEEEEALMGQRELTRPAY